MRFFLAGIYARDLNLERMYFYNWGGTKIPLVLQAVGGAPTGAALAVEQLQRWLHGASSRSCGRGVAVGQPENVWQCEFEVRDAEGTHSAFIRWTHDGTAATTAGPRTRTVRHLDGTTTETTAGEPILVGEESILVDLED
ncbi:MULTISPECIES: hypothetical protein [unclassified Parafrankia]|uniref:hypothetical protein n=1 Tax=unclassified Parafrankia TaxID=2994368 RepID=UPI000DA4E5F9|nr:MULTISPECIES: hypothetical protein [unclassified Parafrankia]TCJ31580.1 hypothetical protein E0504_47650 [Parafrankia sp. BMG5.11]SQD99955.1 conserved hypothetical protein [Parafrankia sp. Ea1.12]